jgi:hypothetical protein
MDLRPLCGLLFLLTVGLPAQGQDPKPSDPEQADRLAALQREKERLERELTYVKDRVANAKALLAVKLGKRTLSVRTIDAGTAAAAPVAPPLAPRPARLMQADEAATLPADVLMTVAGTPISRSLYEQLVAHQGDKLPPEVRSQMALYELIRIEGTAAEFDVGEVEAVLQEVVARLAEGKSVAELARSYGVLPGADENGRIEIQRNGRFGLRLEQLAFATAPGTTTRPFRHHGGVVVLHVDSVEQGATRELDKVVAHAVQVPYSAEAAQLLKAQQMVAAAQVEVVVRDAALLPLLPPAFRDPADLAPPATVSGDVETLRKSLEELQAEIERTRGSDSEIDKSRLPMLEARMQRLEEELKAARVRAPRDAGGDQAKPPGTEPKGPQD